MQFPFKKNQRIFILAFILALAIGTWFTVQFSFHKNQRKVDPYAGLRNRKTATLISEKTLLANKSVPVLKISNEKEKTVQISKLAISTTIENGVARTRYDMHFYNNQARDLEAELQFPLADGQTISYFAMDVNGEMRPGVAVEKVKARMAYEATVRQGIDPGLIEKTVGNNFKLRVFPVPSKGTKHIVIEYVHELTMDVKKAYYYLPLHFKDRIPTFQYQLSIIGQASEPSILRSCSEDFQLTEHKQIYRSNLKRTNFLANQPILIQLKNEKINRNAAFETKSNGLFFHTNLHIPQKYKRKKMPNKITVFWDVSSSRLLSRLDKEKKLLRRYLSNMKNGEIELIPFGYKIFPSQYFQIKQGNLQQLEKAIKNFQYDGGTILQQLNWAKTTGEEILLFTDGLQNLGDKKVNIPTKELYIIQSSVKSNNACLKYLARKSHGDFIDLMQLSEKESLERLNSKSLHFMGFEEDASLQSYYPSSGQGQNGVLSIAGKLNQERPFLVAKFGIGKEVLLKKRISLTESPKGTHANFELMWAIHQLNELQENSKENEAQILKTGLDYRLVSDFTSMLILDRVEDYVQHRIVPPKSLRKAYYKQLKEELKNEVKTKNQHLNDIKKEWRAEKQWWRNYRKEPKTKKGREQTGQQIILGDAVADMEVSANASMREAPLPPPPSSSSEQTTAFIPPVVENDEITLSPQELTAHGFDVNASAAGAVSYSWTNQVSSSFASTISSTGTYTLSVTSTNGTSISTPNTEPVRGTMRIHAWNPNEPYMKRIVAAKLKNAYSVYLKERQKYASQPSFYLDVSDYLIRKKQYQDGIRVLSNIAELDLDNHSLLRIVAQRLLQLGEKKLAISLFHYLIELRPEEPQSYRDLGLAFEKTGQYNEALRYLYKVVTEPYDGRFDGIQVIALNEINNIIANHPRNLTHDYIDKVFIQKMPVDIRIVLNWDSDDTDVDLWVTEPDGEKCMYSYPLTANGGRISNDFTQGYGPEEYMIRNAKKGSYLIQAHYYGDHRPTVNGKATLSVQLYKQYGTTMQYKREITRRLNVTDDVVDLGEFEF
ncbi:MAG: VIT domain-containing protein [Flavobacteriales bacterium]